MIELEKRALLKKHKFDELYDVLLAKGELLKEEKRYTLVFFSNPDFVEDKDGKDDLRVRIKNGQGEVVMKYGNWHADSAREEYEFHFDIHEIDEVFGVLFHLGKHHGITTYVKRYKFQYERMIITLDEYVGYDDFVIESEIMCEEEGDVASAEKEIDKFLSSHQLSPLSSEGMINFVNIINNRTDLRFDFRVEKIKDWVQRNWEYIEGKK